MRIKTLDILRGIAVLLVLGNHVPSSQSSMLLIQPLLDIWKMVGWIGVDLFFVLSGFLVSSLLFREWGRYGRISASRFLLRRGFKIYPAFYVYLAGLIALKTLYTGSIEPWIDMKKIIAEVCFIQNYVPGIWTHTWSLGVEEHFYLLLAISAYVSLKVCGIGGFRYIGLVYLGVLLPVLILRIINAINTPYTFLSHSTPTHLRVDSLLLGVVLSYYYRFDKSKLALFMKIKWLTFVVSTVLIVSVASFPASTFFVHTVGYTVLSIGFGGILLLALDCSLPSWKLVTIVADCLASIGLYSYSIYLWHISINVWGGIVINWMLGTDHPYFITWSVYLIGSVIMGTVMSKLVEIPFLRIRDRLIPSENSARPSSLTMSSAA